MSFGFLHVRSTSSLAAPWFVGAALGLEVLSTFYVDQQPFLVAGLWVAPSGGLQGLAMQDLSSRTRVIALSRASGGALEHPPRRGTVFAEATAPSCSAPTRSCCGSSNATRRPCRASARHHGAP